MALPASFEAVWGKRDPPTKGPKRSLSLDIIVQAAVEIASEEGLAAVSMSRVAARLGAGTMALYRYVESKGELLALMTDAIFREAPAIAEAAEGWRSALSKWARAHLAVLARHPWAVRIPVSGPPITPNHVLWFERGLACLRDTRLAESEKLSVLLLVNGFVRNEATLADDLRSAARAAGSAAGETGQGSEAGRSAYGALLETLIDAARFPALSALIAARVFEGPDVPDADFEFGLERLLDGIAVLVGQRQV